MIENRLREANRAFVLALDNQLYPRTEPTLASTQPLFATPCSDRCASMYAIVDLNYNVGEVIE